ncbi:MAG TPA: hypothetical protein PLJ84_11295 [Bacteroidales bacterium]|nr:hypothetical protein [Bacteroidales bacterium]
MSSYVTRSLLSVLFFISLSVNGQNALIRKIFPDSAYNCRDLQYQSMQLIPLYYGNRDFDTANAILDYWAGQCSTDETIFRTRILFAIDNGTFSDSLFKNDGFTYYLDVYKELANDTSGSSLYYYPYYYVDEIELLKWYKTFTDSIAFRCLTYTDLSPEERFFATYYAYPSDSIYTLLFAKVYDSTALKKIASEPVYGKMENTQGHYSFSTGMWIPDQRLDTLGRHPYLGAQIGLKHNRYLADLVLDLRFGSSPNTYQVVIDGETWDTEKFFEMSWRLDFGYELFNIRRTEMLFLGGLGYDCINAVNETNDPDNEDDDVSKYLHSFNMNLGGSYRYYLNNNHYLAVTGKYHVLNFRNKGGTDLKGNALTLSLEYGFGMNRWLNDRNTILRKKTKNYRQQVRQSL